MYRGGGSINVPITAKPVNAKGKTMGTFTKTFIAFLTATVFSSAHAQFSDQQQEPPETVQVNAMFHIGDGGIITNVATGLVVSKQEAVASIETPLPILVGIIIGAGGGAGAAVLTGSSARDVLILGFFGGVSGYWGALATAGGWVGVVVYGSGAIGSQAVGGLAIAPPKVIKVVAH